jgi:hypothetical protein
MLLDPISLQLVSAHGQGQLSYQKKIKNILSNIEIVKENSLSKSFRFLINLGLEQKILNGE